MEDCIKGSVCKSPECKIEVVATKEGRLIRKNFWTCGIVQKQAVELADKLTQ